MRLRVEKIEDNPVTLLRRAGYTFQHKVGEEMSFVRALARSGYPRFHVYTKTEGRVLTLHFHLDQKQHTYGEGTRHHGEYENDGALKEEAAHLLRALGPASHII